MENQEVGVRNVNKPDVAWIDDLSVLWRDGNWMKLFPNQTMTEIEKANSIARLGLFGGGALSIFFGSLVFVGLGMLLLLLSSQILRKKLAITESPATENLTGAGGQVSKKRRSRKNKIIGAQVNNMAKVQPEIAQFSPSTLLRPAEGSVDNNLVPQSDVYEFQSGNYMLRTPFPRPVTAGELPSQPTSGPSGTWANSYPFQSGFPTEFGPTPTALAPSAAQFVRNVPGRPAAQQEAAALVGINQYQPAEGPVTFGMFMSDGGNTSTPITPPVPSGTVGSNFATDEYTPRNMAEAGAALTTPDAANVCFPPDKNNLLGNPPVELNRVARPKLCTTIDPRSDSQQFLDGLYESPSTQAAGYNFFPFPVQDMVEARDDFQKFVVEEGQTHYRDKYTYGESAGLYNGLPVEGDLGY